MDRAARNSLSGSGPFVFARLLSQMPGRGGYSVGFGRINAKGKQATLRGGLTPGGRATPTRLGRVKPLRNAHLFNA